MRKYLVAAACGACLAAVALPTFADDWMAAQLRGDVFVFMGGKWQPLKRGGMVPDTEVIRTMASGRVTFTRGKETLDLGPNAQIEIQDRGTAARPNTTVTQYFGSVSVEAQVENVQHFEVRTSMLAAVVKGTKFTVIAGKTKTSVSVQRGHVAVTDSKNHSHVLISVGQSATFDSLAGPGMLEVSGVGTLPSVIPSGGSAKSSSVQPGIGSFDAAGSDSAGIGNGKGNSGVGQGNGGPNGKHQPPG